MTDPATSAKSDANSATLIDRRKTSWGRLVAITLSLAAVGSGGVYWWAFEGGEKWWQNFLLPARAAFQGKVTLDGVPLRGGQLTTWPDRVGVPRSAGFINQEGEFILQTDINGTYVDIAFEGHHRISVAQFAQQVGPSAPRMTSPAKYADPATSGLQITVHRDPAKNHAVFDLVSDPNESQLRRPTPPAGPPNQPSPPSP